MAVLGTVAMAEEGRIVVDGSTTVGPIAKAFAEYYMEQAPGRQHHRQRVGQRQRRQEPDQRHLRHRRHVALHEGERVQGRGGQRRHARRARGGDGRHRRDRPPEQPGAGPDASSRSATSTPARSRTGRRWAGRTCRSSMISRDTNSGTYETFETTVMNRREDRRRRRVRRQQRRRAPERAEHAGGHRLRRLGFVDRDGQGRSRSTASMPTPRDRRHGQLPHRPAALHVHQRLPRARQPAVRVRDDLPPKKGQEIIEDIGFVPVTDY